MNRPGRCHLRSRDLPSAFVPGIVRGIVPGFASALVPGFASALVLGLVTAVAAPRALAAQDPVDTFRVENEAGESVAALRIVRVGGAAMLPVEDLRAIGAEIRDEGGTVRITWGDHVLTLEPGRPVILVDGVAVQLVAAPRRAPVGVVVPVQLLTDVLPDRTPDLLLSDGSAWRAILADAGERGAGPGGVTAAAAPRTRGERAEGPRVVVIDPGHGGDDPGAVGPTGVREKDIALGVGRALAALLADDPDFEVHLTRDDDRLVPLWERGPAATALKGERPGVFVSIHVNAVSDRAVRGFETYFLSEARTEHERRVAALENAAMAFGDRGGTDMSTDPELGFILNELRNFDHQRWSADLAAEVQERLDPVHPASNRGVKQGPLAVITNSIMPSVLVELGFVSNPAEERLLADEAFQQGAAEALAEAIRGFFERYPPGDGR